MCFFRRFFHFFVRLFLLFLLYIRLPFLYIFIACEIRVLIVGDVRVVMTDVFDL
jgi:hypothetical protein